MIETKKKRKNKRKIVRTQKKGGAIDLFKARSSADYFSINNQKIPPELAAYRFILYNLYGIKGKVLELPYPGEIFFVDTDRNIENAYVCVQSCISPLKTSGEFNDLQNIISKSAATQYTPEDLNSDKLFDKLLKDCNLELYNKHLSLSHINYILRSGMSQNHTIFKMYKKIIDMEKDKKLDLNARFLFVRTYNKIKGIIDKIDLVEDEKLGTSYRNSTLIYGIPLIKFTQEMFEKGLCSEEKVLKSQTIKGFSMSEIRKSIRVEGIQAKLKKKLRSFNLDQEDSYNNRFGILDLEDSNLFPYSRSYKDMLVNAKEGYNLVQKKLGETSPEDTTLKETSPEETKEPPPGETKEPPPGETKEPPPGETKENIPLENYTETEEAQTDDESEIEDVESEKEPPPGETEQAQTDDESEIEGVESENSISDTIQELKNNYEKFEKQTGKNPVGKKANEIVKLVFPNDKNIEDLIKGNKIKIIKDFVIVEIKTKIKAAKENGKEAIGNLYILQNGKMVITSRRSGRRLSAIRKELDYNGSFKDSEKIYIKINPKLKGRYIRVCYKYGGVEEYWLSVFSSTDDERIYVKKNTAKLGGYSERIRKKSLRKRYYSKKGGGLLKSIGKTIKKYAYDIPFTGSWSSSFLSLLRKWNSTRMIDIEARRKNWNSRIGDTFLWLGNKYLYEKYQITTRELNTLGMLNETYGETRENTYLDSNTMNRLPEENSYCTIIGFGTDVLYTTPESSDEENKSEKKDFDRFVEYGTNYKHNNLLNGPKGKDKTLLYDRITSRIIREDIAMKMREKESGEVVGQSRKELKYEWAFNEKDSEYYSSKSSSGEKKDYIQKREKTPNKSCYYIIESKTRSHLPAKICKVYLDEMQLWGQNYSRFTSLLRRMGRSIKSLQKNERTTQEAINDYFKDALNNWSDEITEEQVYIKKYAPKDKAKILDNFPFIRSLPATLYSYITDYIINYCSDEETTDPLRILDNFKNSLSKSNVVDENIYYRYPDHLENFEKYNHYYFPKRHIRHILKTMGQSDDYKDYRLIPRMFKDLENLKTEQSNEFDILYNSIVDNSDKYSLNKIIRNENINPQGITNEVVINFFPNIRDTYDEKIKSSSGIDQYLQDLINNNMEITKIGDINKYGIDMYEWMEKNKAYSNKFIETDRFRYMSFPSLLNISPKTNKTIKIYSLGYYIFSKHSDYGTKTTLGDDNQSLYFLDRHITKERYENSINTFSKYSASESDLSKLSNSDDMLHAPIIFIIHDGKLYIPPIFYSISDNSLLYMKEKIKTINPQWSMKEFKPPHIIDIREYSIAFIKELKKKKILYIKNIDLPSNAININKNENDYLQYDNNYFNQYNSKKRILPVNSTFINPVTMEQSMISLNDLDGDMIQDIDKKLEIQTASNVDELNRIFGDFKTISMEFYDYTHLLNVAEKINAIESQTGTTTTAAIMQKFYEFNKTKVPMDVIHLVGIYTEGSLFFTGIESDSQQIWSDNIEFFKYLYYKYFLGIKLFNEWPEKNNKGQDVQKKTFIRWEKLEEKDINLVLEPNMIMRLNSKHCISMYKNVKDMTNSAVYEFLVKLHVEMAKNESIKFQGILSSTAYKTGHFAKGVASNVISAPGAPTTIVNKGGGKKRKTIQKKKKYQKNKAKIKRTNKKLKKTNKRLKRTNKKRAYNP